MGCNILKSIDFILYTYFVYAFLFPIFLLPLT